MNINLNIVNVQVILIIYHAIYDKYGTHDFVFLSSLIK